VLVAVLSLFVFGVASEETKSDGKKTDSPADATEPENRPSIQKAAPHTSADPSSKGDGKDDSKKDDAKKSEKVPAGDIELDDFDINSGSLTHEFGESTWASARRALRSAQIHMKLGAAEHGNLQEFEMARQSLDSAAEMIVGAKTPHSRELFAAVQERQAEIDSMRKTASTTFFGQFPLVRAFGMWPEIDEDFEVHSYARKGEALRRAIYGALNQIGENASTVPLHTLIIVPGQSVDERKTSALARVVDSVSLEAFSKYANITVYPGNLRTVVDPMPPWNATDPAFEPLARQFLERINRGKEQRSIMLVLVREFTDDKGDGHWVQAQQRTYEASTLLRAEDDADSLEADKVKVFETLAHDRSRFGFFVISAAVVLYLISQGIHRFLIWQARLSVGDWQRWLAIPSLGFLIGLGLTRFIMLAMKQWLPDPQSDALSVAWWPCLAGALSLIVPAGAFRLGIGTIGRYLPGLSCHGRWGIAFVPVALGVSAAWIRPACYAIGYQSAYLIFFMAITGSLIVYCFGRAVDVADEFPVALTPIALGLSLMFGGAAFMASPILLGAVTALALLTTLTHVFMIWRTEWSTESRDVIAAIPDQVNGTPQTISQLRLALTAPRYQPTRALQKRQFSTLEKTVWIGLSGPAAAGKSAAAQYLIDQFLSHHSQLQVLAGRCTESSPPYQPFREALADLGASAGIITSQTHGGEVNTIFERLADEFIPFWDFFSVDSDDEGNETSRYDLLEGVLNALRKAMERRPVVMFLDDVHWMDEGSLALLKQLRENFPPGCDDPLAILLTTRDPDAFNGLELDELMIELTPPTSVELVQILQKSFGIERNSARHLVKALGVMSQDADSIFWMIRAVGELANDQALIPSAQGFRLHPVYLRNHQLPVPSEMREKLEASLRASGQYLPVLECAALLGKKFRVSDVADCLGMDRLNLLQILRHLDQELQLVRDVPNDQDCYAFSSEFMLEIVRNELGVSGSGSRRAGKLSKIARELHARIATVLSLRTPRTPQLVYNLAEHYAAAGLIYANECVDHCLAAADMARSQFAFRSARTYLTMAEECARVTRRVFELSDKRKQIDCDETKFEQHRRKLPAVLPQQDSPSEERVPMDNVST
jgi:hypothetical protein